jgi:hypothetical protein
MPWEKGTPPPAPIVTPSEDVVTDLVCPLTTFVGGPFGCAEDAVTVDLSARSRGSALYLANRNNKYTQTSTTTSIERQNKRIEIVSCYTISNDHLQTARIRPTHTQPSVTSQARAESESHHFKRALTDEHSVKSATRFARYFCGPLATEKEDGLQGGWTATHNLSQLEQSSHFATPATTCHARHV